MKRRDIDKLLKGAGWKITPGGNHKEINEYTAKGILEDAGLK